MYTHPRLALACFVSLLAACSSAPSADGTRYAKSRPATPAATSARVATTPPPVATPPPQPVPAITPPPAPAPVVLAPAAPVTPAAPVAPAAPVVAAAQPVATPESIVVLPPPPAPVMAPGTLHAKRSGASVRLNWALPVSSSGYRAIEVMRNTQEQASGRTRIRALRATITELEDIVPDSQANYWYWLKVTHADGTIENLGPVAVAPQS